MKLLLVEDEWRMAEALCELLQQEGYAVDTCGDGLSALQAAEHADYDLIVLDVMLPGLNGFEVAKAIRALGQRTPILMLTAKSALDDKVTGLDSGADDYLTKPFEAKELLARLRALGRRNGGTLKKSLSFGDLSLETDSFLLQCTASGKSVRLSRREYRILELFLCNQGQVLTREQIAMRIGGYEDEAEYNNVEVYLSFTRKKLSFIGSQVEIKAIRGLGYELRDRHV